MGWWKLPDSETLIGDAPLDALGGAVSEVLDQYRAAHGRRPTRAEWEALLCAVLGAEDEDFKVLDAGVVKEVRIGVTSAT